MQCVPRATSSLRPRAFTRLSSIGPYTLHHVSTVTTWYEFVCIYTYVNIVVAVVVIEVFMGDLATTGGAKKRAALLSCSALFASEVVRVVSCRVSHCFPFKFFGGIRFRPDPCVSILRQRSKHRQNVNCDPDRGRSSLGRREG